MRWNRKAANLRYKLSDANHGIARLQQEVNRLRWLNKMKPVLSPYRVVVKTAEGWTVYQQNTTGFYEGPIAEFVFMADAEVCASVGRFDDAEGP